ncbi:hypothetical protein AALP_AA3G107700 [Arabis alpina]|uniref:Uncharacterized protein n=1 Tax=Arabis alpina TaxID=50452 RepID=A0A087H8E3_ARAAL|nr:hypothetical protein AALP_AA3G107700 [Arabis alpina]
MWRYSTAKFFLLLLLVEVSLGRYLADLDSSSRSNVSSITTLEDLYPNGNVTIKFDIMSETSDSYTANVTILNYFKNKLKNHEIVGPWELGWIWMEDEILLSTVGAKGTQSGYDLTG